MDYLTIQNKKIKLDDIRDAIFTQLNNEESSKFILKLTEDIKNFDYLDKLLYRFTKRILTKVFNEYPENEVNEILSGVKNKVDQFATEYNR